MPDFARGKIYKLVSATEGVDEIYVGSTTYPYLSTRMGIHRSDARSLSSKVYVYMRKHGLPTFKIVLLEAYPCESREELNKREDHWRLQLGASLNTRAAHGIQRGTEAWRARDRSNQRRLYAARKTARRLRLSPVPSSAAASVRRAPFARQASFA